MYNTARSLIKKVKFFEVDLPATLEHKKRLITKILGFFPDYVAFTPIDFNTQTLEEVLKKAGYDENKNFIKGVKWE
jgi:O-methyltransferase involved in polyketide biosynthesis